MTPNWRLRLRRHRLEWSIAVEKVFSDMFKTRMFIFHLNRSFHWNVQLITTNLIDVCRQSKLFVATLHKEIDRDCKFAINIFACSSRVSSSDFNEETFISLCKDVHIWMKQPPTLPPPPQPTFCERMENLLRFISLFFLLLWRTSFEINFIFYFKKVKCYQSKLIS